MQQPRDVRNRPLRDLRISVTDRCNFRCRYCMPREVFGADHAFLPRAELLRFEEIARVVGALTPLGVRKVRLTGGEPLLRRNLPALVAMLAGTPAVEDLALTTNGSLLAAMAEPLREAGLSRITVSLDSIDPDVFAAMSDTKIPLQTVLSGIERASSVGFPVKINTVVQRGVNDAGLLDLAGEPPHVTAARELEEEAGIAANDWKVLADLDSTPGFSDESVRVFLATGLTDIGRPEAHDEEADLTVKRVPLAEAVEMVFNGEIANSIAVSGILAANQLRDYDALRPVDAPWPDRPTAFRTRTS